MRQEVTLMRDEATRKAGLLRPGSGLRQWLEVLPFLLPTLVGLALFSAGPVIAAFGLSFTSWDIVSPPQWIGLENYRQLIERELFWRVMRNTLYYTFASVPLALVLALLLALAMNQKLRGTTFYRTVYFLPVISSTVAIALVWAWLYNPEFGLLNYFLRLIGIKGPGWLGDPNWAMPAIILASVWKGLGYYMVIFLAGLQGIPEEYYEAAKIDGASAWQRFRYVTLPLISPTTFFVLVILVIGSFQVFEITFVMTQGGPAYATLTIAYYIFQNAFEWYRMGLAAALAYVLFAMILVITVIQWKVQGRWVHYQ